MTADAQYKAAKTDSKTKLLISKDKLDGAEQEVRQRFQQLEEARTLFFLTIGADRVHDH